MQDPKNMPTGGGRASGVGEEMREARKLKGVKSAAGYPAASALEPMQKSGDR